MATEESCNTLNTVLMKHAKGLSVTLGDPCHVDCRSLYLLGRSLKFLRHVPFEVYAMPQPGGIP